MALIRQSVHGAHTHPLPTPVHHPAAARTEVPTHHLTGDGMGSEAAYDFITAELLLDGAARLNLATFVTTWMPPIACRLMAEIGLTWSPATPCEKAGESCAFSWPRTTRSTSWWRRGCSPSAATR